VDSINFLKVVYSYKNGLR